MSVALRNAVLFLVGVGGIIYEAVWAHPVNGAMLSVFAGMAGLPAFLPTVRNSDNKSVR